MSRAHHWPLVLAIIVILGATWASSRHYPLVAYPAALATIAVVYILAYRAGKRRATRRFAQRRGRPTGDPIVDDFHRLYYDSMVFAETHWLGTPALKCPLDLWVYQEIIQELRPDVIVETGVAPCSLWPVSEAWPRPVAHRQHDDRATS